MSSGAPPSFNYFTNSMSMRSLSFDLYSHDAKQEYLDGSSTGIPERAANSILPCYIGALQDCGSPSPLGYDHTGN